MSQWIPACHSLPWNPDPPLKEAGLHFGDHTFEKVKLTAGTEVLYTPAAPAPFGISFTSTRDRHMSL